MSKWWLMAAACGLLLAGCGTFSDVPEEEIAVQESAEVRLGDRLLAAIQDNNYAKFRTALSGELAEQLTAKDFATSQENFERQFGRIVSFRYLTELKTPVVRNLVWQVAFERRGSDGKTIEQELLFRLVTGEADNRINVISLGFF